MHDNVLIERLKQTIQSLWKIRQESEQVVDTLYSMDAVTLADGGSQLSHDLIDCFFNEFRAVLLGVLQRSQLHKPHGHAGEETHTYNAYDMS